MDNRYGWVEPKVKRNHWRLGDNMFGGEEINPTGQWGDFLPKFEKQRSPYFDTMHCTVYGTLNCLETLEKFRYDIENNWSERYGGVNGGLVPQGGNCHTVAEGIRKKGCIPQTDLDWTPDIKSWWTFSSPRPMTREYLDIGDEWLKDYNFSHDWVFVYNRGWFNNIIRWIRKPSDKTDLLKEALRSSPVGVSVKAWKYRNGLAYKNKGEGDNHWIMLYGYEEGKCWLLYDHYDKMFVKAEWNYDFGYAKRYGLTRIDFEDITPEELTKKYPYAVVKGHLKSAVYSLYGFKKHVYPNRLTLNAYGHNFDDVKVFNQKLVDQVPDGDMVDIRKSKHWELIKSLDYPENMKKLKQILDEI